MSLLLENLDATTREFMLKEVNFDIQTDKVFISDKLNQTGREKYTELLISSITNGNDVTFSKSLQYGCLDKIYQYINTKGTLKTITMPANTAESIAESEFNRYYIRGLCRRTINDGKMSVQIYRASLTKHTKQKAEEKVGQVANAATLLFDLRRNLNLTCYLGIAFDSNTGLSVRLI